MNDNGPLEKSAALFALRGSAVCIDMKRATKNGQERKSNGYYGSKIDTICLCGRRLGEHLAEHPYPGDDFECGGFKKSESKI